MNIQNQHLLEDLFQETNNKRTEDVAKIDHYHGGEMRHMQRLLSPTFECASSNIKNVHI